MQNFSPLDSFISKFLQQQANRAASNIVVGANAAANALANAQNQPPQLQQQTLQQQASLNTQFALAQMESTQRAVLVKELLNLPSTLQELISTLQNSQTQNAQNTAQNAQLQNLQTINIAALMQLMQTNGKDALAKIMQLAGMLNKQGNVDNKQLQELQFIVNACMPNATTTNTQFMKNLILLYLPWLPIGENNNFDIEFTSSEEQGGEDTSDDTITILIKTENYGNVKVLLVLEAANRVNIVINCAKIFPKELLLSKLKENSKEYKLETAVAVNEHETVERSELSNEQKIHMSGASVLNPYVLLMAHAVIRNVIEIDKSQSLVQTRKKAAIEKRPD